MNAVADSALIGPAHQVVSAETAPPQATAASSSQPALAASQRVLVTLCVHAKSLVRPSSSDATSGAPHSMPSTTGTTSAMYGKSLSKPFTRLGCCCRQPAFPAQLTRTECQRDAIWKPSASTTAASAASSTDATAAWARYWRQTSQVMILLQSS